MTEVQEVKAEVIEPSKEIQVAFTPAEIEANFQALEAWVDQKLAQYEGIEIDIEDDEQVKGLNAVCTDINQNVIIAIDNRRKEIKRQYEAPLKEFEARVKAITNKAQAARQKLLNQVNDAREVYESRKYAALEEHYLGIAGDFAELVPYDKIHEGSWLGKSVKVSKAEDAISEKAVRVRSELETLRSTPLEYATEAKMVYYNTIDLQAALKENQRLIDAKKAADDKEAAEKRIQENLEKARRSSIEAAAADPSPAVPETTQEAPKEWFLLRMLTDQDSAIQIATVARERGIECSLNKKGPGND